MDEPVNLPGLERLMEACRRLGLDLLTEPPVRAAPGAGTSVAGLPFDPVLASIYSRWSKLSFATDAGGVVLVGNDDSDIGLEKHNAWWRENYQASLQLQLFLFAGEPLLAYHYATVPELADAQGRQPVVHVDTYDLDGPFALPVASNVDQFFDTYSRYLEELVSHPEFQEERGAALLFPWGVPALMSRDAPLVELIRAGRFNPILKKIGASAEWIARVQALAGRNN